MKPLGYPTNLQRNLQPSWQTLIALKPWRTEQPKAVALLLLHGILSLVRPATINVTAGKLELMTSGVVAGIGFLAGFRQPSRLPLHSSHVESRREDQDIAIMPLFRVFLKSQFSG